MVKITSSKASKRIKQTYLKHQAFFIGALQREAAEPQVVGAVLGQLPEKTRHALGRGS